MDTTHTMITNQNDSRHTGDKRDVCECTIFTYCFYPPPLPTVADGARLLDHTRRVVPGVKAEDHDVQEDEHALENGQS